MGNVYRKGVLALFIALAVSGALFGQSDLGTISGFVTDRSGATVPNARVTVRNQAGLERQATTNWKTRSLWLPATNVVPAAHAGKVLALPHQGVSTHPRRPPSTQAKFLP
jgi:hypothetical protein